MTSKDVVRDYYAAYLRGDLASVEALVHPQCIIDEPDFLPYGRVPVVGFPAMQELIAGTFATVFHDDIALDEMRLFEEGDDIIAQCIWRMTPRYGGPRIDCHYHEYFGIRAGQIVSIRPFYHAVDQMAAAFERARQHGVDLHLSARRA